jgi:hypothetical protein
LAHRRSVRHRAEVEQSARCGFLARKRSCWFSRRSPEQ